MRLLTPLAAALLMAAPALADEEAQRYRLLVADAQVPTVQVVDLGTGAPPVRFELASTVRLHLAPDGRHAFAIQRDAGTVQVIDTGRIEEDHGDHSALIFDEPALINAKATGERPVHFNSGGGRIAVFWDGTGTATLHETTTVADGDFTPLATIDTGAPHHGVTVPVGETVITSLGPEGEGLPDELAVMDLDGTERSRIDCLNLHGEGKAGSFIAFGCEDGVAVFDIAVSPAKARFLAYPDDAPEGMVRTLLSPRETLALVGNFGADRLTVFDPSSDTGDFSFVDLPAPRMAFVLDEAGNVGFAILADGRLVRFSALTGRILDEAENVTGTYSMERGVVRPMMASAGDRVVVSDPAAGEIVVLDANTLKTERLQVGGAPRSLIILAVEADHED
ncbi:MAG: hypothetical protein AAGB11_15455 [Pseudomonadota bacterium]